MGTKKNFVLDTNVILHDYKCIENFQENDIYLPIVVLEELDRFKKGSEQINYNAREFVRELDLITTNDLFTKGVIIIYKNNASCKVFFKIHQTFIFFYHFPENLPVSCAYIPDICPVQWLPGSLPSSYYKRDRKSVV